ncbi:MAG: acetyl-CoA carboxylase carboxyltransferase subunit alpha [Alphaproteobacteria bacterium]
MEYLEFEKSTLKAISDKIEEYQKLDSDGDLDDKIKIQQEKYHSELKKLYSKLTSWQKTQVARHPQRPHAIDIIDELIEDYIPLAGDRVFAEDAAIIGGLGRFNNRPVMVIGQEKGHDTDSRIKHNFGMPRPEGYRKAQRLMQMAAQFKLPILTFVDTAGAWPGIDAEERGQSEAIAKSIATCLSVETPMIATIVGEGGSGGAIALAAGNKVNMLEHSIYSVITPEGCASILWRDAAKAKEAAEALRFTAQDLKKLELIDVVIKEPVGAAHRDKKAAIGNIRKVVEGQLAELENFDGQTLKEQRRDKFLAMGKHGLS